MLFVINIILCRQYEINWFAISFYKSKYSGWLNRIFTGSQLVCVARISCIIVTVFNIDIITLHTFYVRLTCRYCFYLTEMQRFKVGALTLLRRSVISLTYWRVMLITWPIFLVSVTVISEICNYKKYSTFTSDSTSPL